MAKHFRSSIFQDCLSQLWLIEPLELTPRDILLVMFSARLGCIGGGAASNACN